jgi:hypothetical protein
LSTNGEQYTLYINGEVENKSNRTLKSVNIIVSVRDDKGAFLGAENGRLYPYNLEPDCFSMFEIHIFSVSNEIKNISIKYNFQYDD